MRPRQRPVPPDIPPDVPTDIPPDISRTISAHDAEVLARERQRADQAEAREAELRLQLERQGRELTAALLRTAIAETEARALREALEEARVSWLVRIIQAWRRSGK